MRKVLAIGTALAMVLIGFMAMATPLTANDMPTIEKTKLINGRPGSSAWLGDTVTFTITVYVPVGMGGGTVTDEIPDRFMYIPGSFMVGESTETPNMKKGVISYEVGEGQTVISFDTLYTDAPGDPQGETVTNTAYLKVGCTTYSASVSFTARKYCNFNKYVINMIDDGDGDGVIEVGENIIWDFKITIYNSYSWPMVDAEIKDNFGAELEFDNDPIVTQGTYDIKLKGKSQKIQLFWHVGDIDGKTTESLSVQISTDLNPAGKQEYTSPGHYYLNSGAVLKFKNPDGIQLSAHTDILEVTVVEPN